MPLDRNITYRARIDDSDFQAKLTQMRASMDSTFGGAGMGGGGFGANTMSYMNSFQQGGSGSGAYGGSFDAGYSIAPLTYNPIPNMITPNSGQLQMRQTLGSAISAAFTGAPMFGGPPAQMTLNEYMTYSQKQLSDSVGRGIGTATMATGNAVMSTIGAAAGSIAGTALGGPIGGFIGSIAGSMIADKVSTPYTDSLADNFRLQDFLGATSFRYMTGQGTDPYTGRGMSRQDREKAAEGIMSVQRNDFRINMGDVENILQGGTNLGLFEGSTDVDDFQKKFKGLVGNVKRLTAVLHESAGEAMQTIKAFKDMGVTDPNQINSMAFGADALGIASGKTGSEMVAIGQAGAEIFRGTGVNMSKGFQMNMMNTALITQARNQGMISMEDVAQMGGVEAFAQTNTAGTLGFLQSGMGRTLIASRYNSQNNTLNPNNTSSDVLQMGMQAAGNLNSVQAVFGLQANQTKMINELSAGDLQAMQMQGAFAMTGTLISAGARPEDALRLGADAAGFKTEAQKNMLEAFVKNPDKLTGSMMDAAALTAQKEVMEDFRDTSPWMYAKNAASNWAMRELVDPISNRVARMSTNVAESVNRNIASRVLGADVMTSNASAGSDMLGNYVSKQRTQASLTTVDTRGLLFGDRIQRNGTDQLADDLLGKQDLDQGQLRGAGQKLQYGYAEGTAFSDLDKAKEAATALIKSTGHDVTVIQKKYNGQNIDLVVDNTALANANKKAQSMVVSEEALKKAAGNITTGEIQKVSELQQTLGGAKSADEVIDIMNKNKITGGHILNSSSEEDRATAAALMNTIGGKNSALIRQQFSGKREDVQTSARGATTKRLGEEKDLYMNALDNVLGHDLMNNRGAVSAVNAFYGDVNGGDENMLKKNLAAAGVMGDDASRIISDLQSNNIGMYQKLRGRNIKDLAGNWVKDSEQARDAYVQEHQNDEGIAAKAKAAGKDVGAFLSQMYDATGGTRKGSAETGTGIAKPEDFDQIAKSTAATMQLIVTLSNSVKTLQQQFDAKGGTF